MSYPVVFVLPDHLFSVFFFPGFLVVAAIFLFLEVFT